MFVLESIRRISEIESLKSKLEDNFILLSCDADIKVRFERIKGRDSVTDKIGFEEFLNHEKRESESTNIAEINIPNCINFADFKFENNSNVENLEKQIEEMIIKFPDFF